MCRFLQRQTAHFPAPGVGFCNIGARIFRQWVSVLATWHWMCYGTWVADARMPFVVSKSKDWQVDRYIKVPFHLVCCEQLTPNAKLLLMALMNQVGFRPVNHSTLDRLLGIHRSTRTRCLAELKELGFLGGSDTHIVLNDPMPILRELRQLRDSEEEEARKVLIDGGVIESAIEQQPLPVKTERDVEKRDYVQEATEAWNLYRPADYQAARRLSAQLVKAVDMHMRDLGVKAHRYEEFFSILKAGVERSDFWSKQNTSKTLQSITGIGSASDKKRSNVYNLFNLGVDAPAQPAQEDERHDTVVYPAAYRKIIDEYEAAQHAYQQASQNRTITSQVESYVRRTEQAVKDLGLDPVRFRFKYGLSTWPTDTPEPQESRVVTWTFDDEYSHAY